MFYDPLSVSNEEESAQNILCINDHRQWASPMFTINVNQAYATLAPTTTKVDFHGGRPYKKYYKEYKKEGN
jgi:hypothetical protein